MVIRVRRHAMLTFIRSENRQLWTLSSRALSGLMAAVHEGGVWSGRGRLEADTSPVIGCVKHTFIYLKKKKCRRWNVRDALSS